MTVVPIIRLSSGVLKGSHVGLGCVTSPGGSMDCSLVSHDIASMGGYPVRGSVG